MMVFSFKFWGFLVVCYVPKKHLIRNPRTCLVLVLGGNSYFPIFDENIVLCVPNFPILCLIVQAFEFGLFPGMALSALEHYVLKGKSPWTMKHGRPDHEATNEAHDCLPVEYPKPDGAISFDISTSLYRSNTNHDHDQPPHLRLNDPSIPECVNLPIYAAPESRYCPARVYEYVPDEKGELKLQINAQNCLHCKACDIKDPKQNIKWTVPEGGGGPGYSVM
ncbi:hypothetical protein Leryth_001775 [Lithospermum erythrorhizon]|nr:hypothetical protein Leryth_001775 [Lithospermum erythrorhizon]